MSPDRETAAGDELVVLVRDTSTVAVVKMAEVVRRAGCRVALVTGPAPEEVRARLAPAFDRVVEVPDLRDAAAVADAVKLVADEYRLGAVLASSDSCVVVAAQAAQLAGLARTPAAPIAAARNKYAAREILRRAGAPVPRYALLGGPEQVEQVAAQVGLPAVVKPASGTGSHLVSTVGSVPELATAYQRAVRRLADAPLGNLYRQPLDCAGYGLVDPARVVLVEGALVGRELCVDLVIRDGEVDQLGLVDKFLLDERFFELGFVSPPFDLPPQRQEAILACARDAVRALGLDNTVAHVEVIDDARLGPTIVEVNPGRPGGPGPMMLYLTAGVNTVEELVAAHRGAPAARPVPAAPVPLASFCMYARGAGRLRAVHGLERVAAHPDVVSVMRSIEPGDHVTDEHEVIVATVVVAGFGDREELVGTYHELDAAISLEFAPE